MIETGFVALSSHCWLPATVKVASSRLMTAGNRGSRLRPSWMRAVNGMTFPVELRNCMPLCSHADRAVLCRSASAICNCQWAACSAGNVGGVCDTLPAAVQLCTVYIIVASRDALRGKLKSRKGDSNDTMGAEQVLSTCMWMQIAVGQVHVVAATG